MADPTFTRPDNNRPLFYLQMTPRPTNLPPDYAIAFLPATTAGLPLALDISTTWVKYTGIYLFLGKNVTDEQRLVDNVKQYIAGKPVRFLWITNPQDPYEEWATSSILLNANNTLAAEASITFSNYLLKIPNGTLIQLHSSNTYFYTGKENIVFQRDGYVLPTADTVQIPFSGENVGSLECSLRLTDSPGTIPAFEQLDACISYFVSDPASGPDALAPLRYPVLNLKSGPQTLYARLDPVNVLVRGRTDLRFLEFPQSPGTPINSAFTTIYGSTVKLTPLSLPGAVAGPRLVFTRLPLKTTSNQLYLTFDGPFYLNIPSVGSTTVVSPLLSGFSGIEYFGHSHSDKNVLTFIPDQPAYAAGFQQAAPVSAGTPPLSDRASTAWVSMTPAAGQFIKYFSQPEGATFYAPTNVPANTWLSYLEIFAGTFPTGQSNPFPMVPYALLKPAILAEARQLEVQILSPYRRALLVKTLIPTGEGVETGKVLSATPQGWLLQLDKDLRYWQYLTFAAQQNGVQLIQVKNVKGDFKVALQTNQLFAVISNKDEFLRCCEVNNNAFKLTIDGWGFDLTPADWGAQKTIMLIKYAGQSIEELATNADTWSWQKAADGWNDQSGDIQTTRAELQEIIKQAKEHPDKEYADFYVNIIKNPDWNGVLFLRAPVYAFPPDLQSLVVGVNEDALYAHHIGANSTPILLTQGQIETQDSALFGLIDYADSEDLYFDNLDYAYKVLALKVAFQNSTTTSFNSQIELMINKLFSDYAMLDESVRSNNLVLNGFLQGEGDEAAFVFLDEGSHVFRLEHSVLNRVEVTRVQFLTLPERQDRPGTVFTVFVLSGSLEFEELPGFDIFSFGSLPGSQENGGRLQFSNMLIHMDFPEDQPSNLDFRFDVESMAFNQASSTARPDSLFQHFPLKVAGLLQGLENSTPGDTGYISVKSPLVQSVMDYPWYGLTFELDLGTLGALAGDVGLTVTLLAAWKAAEGTRRTYVGIKLPGATGARPELPIEGVLKLNFSGIEFTVNHEQGSAYMLHFKNMALRLLSFSFPPGQTDILLFGDPSGGNSGTLGWYASYAKDEKPAAPDRLRLRRRLIVQGEAEHA